MSYSFSAKGDNKIAAREAARQQFIKVLENQPAHKNDEEAAFKNLDNHLNLLAEPNENEEVNVSMNGSVSVDGGTAGRGIVGASSSCSVSLYPKPPEATLVTGAGTQAPE